LASTRAITVMKSMIDAGMPATRVSAASFGETSPVQSNDTPEGRMANRRIAIVVVPDLSTLPGYEELQKFSQ
jgi:chemotaxis protein MotB